MGAAAAAANDNVAMADEPDEPIHYIAKLSNVFLGNQAQELYCTHTGMG